MAAVLDPLVSEFSTHEAEIRYDQWLRAKVQRAIDSKEPRIPHDQVMAEMRKLLDAKRDGMNASRVE